MPNFVLHRNKVVRTTMGHAIEFIKGQLTHVPPECIKDVLAIGAVPEEELEEEKLPSSKEPADPEQRKKVIVEALQALKDENKRESFSGTGVPKPNAVSALVEFDVPKKEIEALWVEMQQPKD